MSRNIKLLILAVFLFSGCAWKAYIGLHGTSVMRHPDIHEGVTKDSECRNCHQADAPEAPPSPHPNFTGCLKCHNDPQ